MSAKEQGTLLAATHVPHSLVTTSSATCALSGVIAGILGASITI